MSDRQIMKHSGVPEQDYAEHTGRGGSYPYAKAPVYRPYGEEQDGVTYLPTTSGGGGSGGSGGGIEVLGGLFVLALFISFIAVIVYGIATDVHAAAKRASPVWVGVSTEWVETYYRVAYQSVKDVGHWLVKISCGTCRVTDKSAAMPLAITLGCLAALIVVFCWAIKRIARDKLPQVQRASGWLFGSVCIGPGVLWCVLIGGIALKAKVLSMIH